MSSGLEKEMAFANNRVPPPISSRLLLGVSPPSNFGGTSSMDGPLKFINGLNKIRICIRDIIIAQIHNVIQTNSYITSTLSSPVCPSLCMSVRKLLIFHGLPPLALPPGPEAIVNYEATVD